MAQGPKSVSLMWKVQTECPAPGFAGLCVLGAGAGVGVNQKMEDLFLAIQVKNT